MAAFWLRSRGYNVRLLCLGDGQVRQFVSPLGTIETDTIRGSTLAFQLGLQKRLLRARATSGKAAVFYVYGHNPCPGAFLGLVGISRERVIYHTENYIEPGRHPGWEFFERRFARRAGWVISNEPNRARFMMSNYGLPAMPTIVPTALPKDWPTPERSPELRRQLLAKVGRSDHDRVRLVMHEGGYAAVRCGRQLVEAFRNLPEHFVLLFTGMAHDAPAAREVQALAADLGLRNRVIRLASLPFDELMRYTACCDLGILLYPNDGVGNYYQCPGRLSHYLRCGLPTVASNFPGLELLTLKYKLGGVCDPYSAEAIADAILKLGARPLSELAAHGEALKLLARSELAYEAHAWKLEEIVKQARGLENQTDAKPSEG